MNTVTLSIIINFICYVLDVDKQNSINLFLGVYKPWEEIESLWDLRSDCHLHNRPRKKSYAVNFIFQDDEKTLKDKQVDKIMNAIRGDLESKLGAVLR